MTLKQLQVHLEMSFDLEQTVSFEERPNFLTNN